MYQLCKFGAYVGLFQCDQNQLASKQKFANHVAKFNLSYGTPEEYNFRYKMFAEKDQFIEETNASNLGYTLGHNQFSTWSDDEYKRLLGRRIPQDIASHQLPEPAIFDESSIRSSGWDWRDHGAVTPVKNQG